jgi:hypothetical protein
VLLAVISLAVLAGCGDGDDPTSGPTSTASPTESSTPDETSTSASPSEEPSESETPSETATEDGADVEIEVSIVGDTVTTEPSDRVAVEVGDTVKISVVSDVADELHVHGYDLTLDLEPGVPAELLFEVTGDPGPGLYEVELEEEHRLLFQLEVR